MERERGISEAEMVYDCVMCGDMFTDEECVEVIGHVYMCIDCANAIEIETAKKERRIA